MTTIHRDVDARRLDLAGTRSFTAAGAGEVRRAGLAEFGHAWLRDVFVQAVGTRATEGLALAAVGSFARGDAGPLSDFDLVLLHDGRASASRLVEDVADKLWYPIWDAGVKLDHSVRTVNQCRQVASADLSAAVGLLDLAHVAGDPDVVAAARSTVAHDWRANARKRLPQLVETVEERHHRHGDLAQSIEPDLKEAHGGLRDLTILRALVAAWLADSPHGPVEAAQARLLDVRDAQHVVSGRGRDRLGREDQDGVAALLGYAASDDLLTDVSTAGRTIAYALDATLRRAGQAQRARSLRVGPRRPSMNPLGYGLFESDGEVVIGNVAATSTDPVLPLRAAVVAARAGLPISPVTLANLATKAPALPTPWPALARDLFADLLASGPGLVPVWEGLDQAGIIDQWLPEWSAVRSRPQRSPVHRHTVDRHLVETVVHAGGLVREVGRADLLLLAALLHDIGKVPGAVDHSVAGVPIAERVMARLGYPADDIATVTRLVGEHLTLVDLATRRDHEDPRTVEAAVAAVGGDRDVFELLLALTEADASAAGPKAWTDWRARLVRQLADAVRARLDRGVAAAPGDDAPHLAPETVEAIAAGEPAVAVSSSGGSYRIDIVDRDRLGLFADTAGLLASQGLVVRTAVLRTIDGIAIDEWHVEAPSGAVPTVDNITRGLMRLASGDRAPLGLLDRRRRFAARPATRPTSGIPGQARAFVVSGAAADATVIEVRADDRVGLLHELGMTFARAGLTVRSAHIATYAGQALDTFYVTEFGGRMLEPSAVAQVLAMLIDTCDGIPPA